MKPSRPLPPVRNHSAAAVVAVSIHMFSAWLRVTRLGVLRRKSDVNAGALIITVIAPTKIPVALGPSVVLRATVSNCQHFLRVHRAVKRLADQPLLL
jgi:hypothetical protein